MDYETLNEQEWLALLTEMVKADNVIKKRLAKVLVNKSEFFHDRIRLTRTRLSEHLKVI